MGCIYYHKNKINGHMYIGQSKCNSDYIKYGRWGVNGQGYKANKYFWHAIKKYGWENFEHGFFEDNVNNELLNEKEKYYIALYHTYKQDPEYKSGYNLTPGGEGSINTWWPEEDAWLVDNYSLEKTRDTLICNYRKAFPDSYHSNDAIKARLKTLRLSNDKNIRHWTTEEDALLSDIWSMETKQIVMSKISRHSWEAIRKRAQKLGLSRQVDCMQAYSKAEDKIFYNNYIEFGPEYCRQLIKEQFGIERTAASVRDHATKVLKLHRLEKFTNKVGFDLSAFADYYNKHTIAETAIYYKITESQVKNIARRHNFRRAKNTIRTGTIPKHVYCIELNKEFKSISDAARVLNISKSNISECCSHNTSRKTAGGYHWRYLDD